MLSDAKIKSLKIEDGKRHADRDGFRQDLINIMNDTDLTFMKKKAKKFISLYKEFYALLMEKDGLCLFGRMGIPPMLFVSFKGWEEFEKILNKKRGSSFNKEKIIKEAYFELLFIPQFQESCRL